jgi:DNA primase
MRDYATLKQQTDALALAEREIGRPAKRRMFNCPFHADKTPSLHVYPDGYYRCFGCDFHGDIYDFIARLHNYSPQQAYDFIAGLGVNPTPRPYDKPRPAPQPEHTITPEAVARLTGQMKQTHLNFWYEAWGIQQLALTRFKIGYAGGWYTYAFPWYYRGAVTAINLRRNDDNPRTPPDMPKYKMMKGSKRVAPFNIDACFDPAPDRVVIVEDEKSVLACAVCGVVAVSVPANQWRAAYSTMLTHISEIIIVPDHDDAGDANAALISGMIRRATIAQPPYRFSDDGRHLTDLFDLYVEDRSLEWLK